VLELHGGLGAYTYQYTTSSNPAGANSWAVKTVEGLPDGNQNIYYTNAYGEVMLSVYHDTTTNQSWPTFYQYDGQGRVLERADPSTVTGYDDSHADLLVGQGGSYQYLSNDSGRLTRYDYYDTTTAGETTPGGVAGYQLDTKLQRGQQGTPVLQERWQYYAHTGGGSTVYPAATDTVYRNETNNPNDPGAQTTHYAYTWFPDSTRKQTMTTDKPVVTPAENGPGTADRTVTTYNGSSLAWVSLYQGGRYDNFTGLYLFRNRDFFADAGAVDAGGSTRLSGQYEPVSVSARQSDPLGGPPGGGDDDGPGLAGGGQRVLAKSASGGCRVYQGGDGRGARVDDGNLGGVGEKDRDGADGRIQAQRRVQSDIGIGFVQEDLHEGDQFEGRTEVDHQGQLYRDGIVPEIHHPADRMARL
jgi:YD repeat-containing protein